MGRNAPKRTRASIPLDKARARERFLRALVLARSSEPLPKVWLDRTAKVGAAVSKTFTPVLGTALLAKATNDQLSALALKASVHKGYSARTLATQVLVPMASTAGIDLGHQGPEPLNNQPFFGKAVISLEMEVKDNARDDFKALVEYLQAADHLRGDDALLAFAAFLRARIAATAARAEITVGKSQLDLVGLLEAVDRFVAGAPEGGKIAQAFVAATFDAAFDDVRTKRINDPSVKWPGDVGVQTAGTFVLVAEVKQRPLQEAEVSMFAQRLHKAHIYRGLLAVFCRDGFPFDVSAAARAARTTYGVDVDAVAAPSELLYQTLRFTRHDLPEAMQLFTSRFMARMEELLVSDDRRQAWADIVGT